MKTQVTESKRMEKELCTPNQKKAGVGILMQTIMFKSWSIIFKKF